MENPLDEPRDPIAAVTHRDPYPYYARLAAERPLYRDDALGLWVASGAEAVAAVLGSEICRVRPLREPVPAALQGTPAGEVFGRLVRMNDGGRHASLKRAASVTFDLLAGGRAAAVSRELAHSLQGDLHDLAFRLPVSVVARLLGARPGELEPAARSTGELAAGFAPGASPEAVGQAGRAALELRRLLQGFPVDGLLETFRRQARSAGLDEETILDNGIGLLLQPYEATAGLIGNTLLALARSPQTLERVRAAPESLGGLIEEVLRRDPAVQNTRRFLAQAGTVAGQEMREGDTILVVLAAANRDPTAARGFGFGAGRHACPGQTLAATIARAGVEQALAAGLEPGPLAQEVRYRPSVNVRVPLFPTAGEGDLTPRAGRSASASHSQGRNASPREIPVSSHSAWNGHPRRSRTRRRAPGWCRNDCT